MGVILGGAQLAQRLQGSSGSHIRVSVRVSASVCGKDQWHESLLGSLSAAVCSF